MIIGVTGGVGAGKSTILTILKEEYGAEIIMADDVAKELMEPGGASYEAVVRAFGEEILEELPASSPEEEGAYPENVKGSGVSPDKRPIDRKKLSALVFQDDKKRELVNSLTHPRVREEILRRFDLFLQEDPEALIILEAALLIETGYRSLLDFLWVVLADREVRIARLIRDRGYTREKALSIMESQLSDKEFRAHADYVIDNSGSIEETERQVADALKKCAAEGQETGAQEPPSHISL